MKLTIPHQLETEMAVLLKQKKREAIDALIQIKVRNPVEYEKQKAQIESKTVEDSFIEMIVMSIIQMRQNDLKALLEADYDVRSKVIQERFTKVLNRK
jgi:hypothetical protein